MVASGEKFLVTGCAGFIGSHIVRKLVADGIEVVGVDDFSTGKEKNIADLAGKFRLVRGSLCDMDVARDACQGATHVIHQASIPSVPRSVDDPLGSLHSSVTATVTLLMAARDAKVRRVVQAASSSAYGDTETLPKTEEMLPKPLSPYAVAKLAQEYYAFSFSTCYGLDTVSLRYFNVFGPRQDPASEYAAVIPKFITMMLEGKAPTIFGDGEQSRDFTYIDNVVKGNLLAARSPKALKGEVINLAVGDRISLNQLVDLLNKILGTDIKVNYAPERAGDVKHSQAGVSKAGELLGFTPVVNFEEGLRRTIEYYRG